MKVALLQIAVVLLALTGAGAVVAAARHPLAPHLHPSARPASAPSRRSRRTDPDSVLRVAVRIAPFRLRRSLPGVSYDPARTGEAIAAQPPRPPRPAISLSGIVSAALPAAIVEGIPGVDGARLLVKGDTIGGLRIRRIGRTEVVVEGFDTTWVLTVKETWR